MNPLIQQFTVNNAIQFRNRYFMKLITNNSNFRYIVSIESGNVLVWNRITEQVLFKEEQPNAKQLTLIENSTKFMVVSRPNNPTGVENVRTTATLIMRTIPGKAKFLIFL